MDIKKFEEKMNHAFEHYQGEIFQKTLPLLTF
jgi:hypothetical protein